MIGERIKKARKELGLTQTEFAHRLGITDGAISRIEKSDRPVTDQMAIAICNTYNLNYTWLKEGNGDMFVKPDVSTLNALDTLLLSDNEAAKQLLTLMSKMNKRQWEVMAEILAMLKE